MDHSITELDACVFDYLTSHADQPKTFTQIYNDISGPNGHRCSALNSAAPAARELYKKRFLTTCYTLDNTFKNVHKVFKNSTPYLIYSNKSRADVMRDFGDLDIVNTNLSSEDYDNNDLENIIEYLLDNKESYNDFNFTAPVSANENMLQFLVRTNKLDKIRKILDNYDIDVARSLIDMATDNNNGAMVRELSIRYYDKQITELNTAASNSRKLNTKLSNQNKILNLQYKSLQNKMIQTDNSIRLYWNISTFSVLLNLLGFFYILFFMV